MGLKRKEEDNRKVRLKRILIIFIIILGIVILIPEVQALEKMVVQLDNKTYNNIFNLVLLSLITLFGSSLTGLYLKRMSSKRE